MPPVEIGMALSGFKAAREMLTAVVDGKNEIATMDRVLEAIRKLGEAQDKMYELREELHKKQDEVTVLKKQLDARGKWEHESAQYSLVTTQGGATVWESSVPMHHYVCPACYANQRISILQDRRTFDGSYACPDSKCKATYLVKPQKRVVSPKAQSADWDPYARRT